MDQPHSGDDKRERLSTVLLLCLSGLLSGLANGLLGAGGGIIAVFGLLRALGKEVERRDVFANALCVMLPLSALSCVRYVLAGHVTPSAFSPYAIPALLGGLAGGFLLGKLQGSLLKKLFGSLVVWSGVLLIIR